MHANETTIRNILKAMETGKTAEAIEQYFVPHFAWRIVGEHTRELGSFGKYVGLEGIAGLQKKIGDYATDYRFNSVESVLADDHMGVSIHRSSAVSNGEPFDCEEVYMWHFEDGKVHEIWDYNRIIHNQMVELGERGVTGY